MSGIPSKLALALLVALLGASGPWTMMVVPAGSGDSPAPPLLTEASAEIPGLTYTYHMLTSDDVVSLKDLMGVRKEGVDYNVRYDGFGTGLAPPTEEQYSEMLGEVRVFDDVDLGEGLALPGTVDHSLEDIFPAVGNQGSQGSCAAWATSYYTNGYAQARDNGWTEASKGTNKSQLMSPAWTYNKVNGGYDSGSNWYDNTAIMRYLGNADMASQTYNAGDLYGWGNETAWRNAPQYRIEHTIDYVAASSTATIKAWIAEGYVCPLALNAGNYNYIGSDGVLNSAEHQGGTANHANTIVGYNDSIVAGNDVGAFHVVNSWGKGWGWQGYYWMTYAAVAELYWSVMRIHDKVDYEPELLATWDQSVLGSKNTNIYIGTDSGMYPNFDPWWDGGSTRLFPAFMAFDATDIAEDIGVARYKLYYGTGTTTGTVSRYGLEWYQDGYEPGSPTAAAFSADTPKKGAATMWAEFRGVHIDVTSPETGSWHRADVTFNGTATERLPQVVLDEGFESPWAGIWSREDRDAGSGEDTWGWSEERVNTGMRSAWCAGGEQGVVYEQTFNSGGGVPSGWSLGSDGQSVYPFAFVNTGYRGCGGSDHLAVANSNRGAGTNMTERLYMSTPFDATRWTGLELRFYIDYDYYSADEHAEVLVANGSTYPNFTSVGKWTADKFGTATLDLSSQDGEARVYLAFLYHGTADRYMAVDDVIVVGEKPTHDNDMLADLYRTGLDLDGFDEVTLAYSYWTDTEQAVDVLSAMCRASGSDQWTLLSNHSGQSNGWDTAEVTIPTNATQVGFRFAANGSVVNEGAYLDDVTLTGWHHLDAIEMSVDGAGWEPCALGGEWSATWDSTAVLDGEHDLTFRALYGARYDIDAIMVRVDNTPPELTGTWCSVITTGDAFELGVNATDLNQMATPVLHYRFPGTVGAGENLTVNATEVGPGEWTIGLMAPEDAVTFEYSFWVEDELGNGRFGDVLEAQVLDDDAPTLGEDLSADHATTGDTFSFRTSALDNIGVVGMQVEYWFDGTEPALLSSDGGDMDLSIQAPHALVDLHYVITATDAALNTITSEERTVPVLDNDMPEFGPDRTDASTTTGENLTVMVDVTDNIGLDGVWVEWWFGEGERTNASMWPVPEDSWTLVVDVPFDSIAPFHYILRSNDTSGNWNRTDVRDVEVLDNDIPWLLEDRTPASATTGDEHTFTLRLLDNVAVGEVVVEYWYGDGEHLEVNATPSSADGWAATVTIIDTLDPLWYVVSFTDTSGNQNLTGLGEVQVLDNDAPTVVRDSSPDWVPTGAAYRFEVDVQDNLGIGTVTVWYWFDSEPKRSQQMDIVTSRGLWDGTYTHTITTPTDSTAELHYEFEVIDLAGNWARTPERVAEVRDIEPPVANAGPEVVIDQHQAAGLDGSGSVDNVELARWSWTVALGATTVDLVGVTPSLVIDDAGEYLVTLTVTDASGNADTDTTRVTVRDVTDPLAQPNGDREIDQGQTARLAGSGSSDNVGVVSWEWDFAYDGAPVHLSGVETSHAFAQPGLYTIRLTVTDAAGNTGEATYQLKVRDTVMPTPPTFSDREARKGEPFELDGTSTADNVGIVNWTWRIRLEGESAWHEVYGPVAEFTFDKPGTHTVELVVADADGNVATSETFTIEVPNVMLWVLIIALVAAAVLAVAVAAARRRRRGDRWDSVE